MGKEKRQALIEMLWQKHCYRDDQSLKSNRAKIMADYIEETGKAIPAGTLSDYIKVLDKESLYSEKMNISKSFNDRTDDLIDDPARLYSPEDLMIAMGANPDTFEMEATTLNKWWLDKGSILDRIRNGQIKIRIKPKKVVIDAALIARLLSKNHDPIMIDEYPNDPNGLLELNLTDMHFGKNTYLHYKEHQVKVLRWIKSQEWEEILLPIGNDLFHWDNFNGTTTALTQVGFQPDIDEAWEDAMRFYFPIIEECLKQSINLNIMYVPGNHDMTLGWAFAKMLEDKYPQAIHDTRNDNYKLFTWEKVAIGLSHGSVPRDFKKYNKIFNELFRTDFAHAEVREIHLGDKHHQMVHDEFGIVTRGLSTASQTDLWHYNNGFLGASQSFQAFIYSRETIEAMLFI